MHLCKESYVLRKVFVHSTFECLKMPLCGLHTQKITQLSVGFFAFKLNMWYGGLLAFSY